MDDDTTRAILDKLLVAAVRDPLRLPDLQEWVAAFGGYNKIPAEAWEAALRGTEAPAIGTAGLIRALPAFGGAE